MNCWTSARKAGSARSGAPRLRRADRRPKIVGTQYRGDAWKSELKGIQTYQQTVPAHPNLLQIFHVGEAENCFYYTMELADSLSEAGYCADTLAERLKRNGRLSAAETLALVGSLLSGLAALHASGLIHRDIKPPTFCG